MDSSYIFAGTNAYVRLQKLLTETQRELLLGAHTYEEFLTSLNDTFLAAYIDTNKPENLSYALDKALLEAKRTIERIAPDKKLFTFVWLQYDFYNLKMLLKRAENEHESDQQETFIPLGTYSYEEMNKLVQAGTFSSLHPYLAAAVRDVKKNPKLSVDAIMDKHYLEAAAKEAKEMKHAFVSEYVRILIDLFNLRSRLRAGASKERSGKENTPLYANGGSIPTHNLEKIDDVYLRLSRFGGDVLWRDAIAAYQADGDFTLVDKAAEDYMMRWLKRQSVDIHSPAPLFTYLAVMRENIQFVRAVATAKYVGLSETTLRKMIRDSYNSYVY